MPERLNEKVRGHIDRALVVILVACSLISVVTISLFRQIPPKQPSAAARQFANLAIALRNYANEPNAASPTSAKPAAAKTYPVRLRITPNPETPTRVTLHAIAESADMWERLSAAANVPFNEVLSFHVLPSDTQELPDEELTPMLGHYKLSGNTLTFSPTFELTPGSAYIARLNLQSLAGFTDLRPDHEREVLTTIHSVSIPPDAVYPSVVGWYPKTQQLPANHLKFYIVFSEPMEHGNIFRHFSLWDKTTAAAVPRPFRHTELWSEDSRTLTLWFHPGRQKTGVNLNVEIGPILDEGHKYELRISGDWRSAAGIPLTREFSKSFKAVAADHAQPDIKQWTTRLPAAQSVDPLIVNFGEVLDWALATRVIQVQTSDGRAVRGRLVLDERERGFEFHPEAKWPAGSYRIAVHPDLEDLAGNSVGRAFEVDVSKSSNAKTNDSPAMLHFELHRNASQIGPCSEFDRRAN